MIDWDQTKSQFNRSDLSGRYPRVATICDKCGTAGSVTIRNKSQVVDDQLPWSCKKCHNNEPAHRQALSESSSNLWLDDDYRNKVQSKNAAIRATPRYRQKLSELAKQMWQDPEYRAKVLQSCQSPEFRELLSQLSKERWADPQYKQEISQSHMDMWQDPKFRQEQLALRNTPETKAKLSSAAKKKWRNLEFRTRVINSINASKAALSQLSKDKWQNPEYRAKTSRAILEASESRRNDPEYQNRMQEIYEHIWANPERRALASAASKKLWQDPEYRAKMAAIHHSDEWKTKIAQIRADQPHVSSLQTVLYSILDDLGIKYYREYNDKPSDPQCQIGPYNFDCVIPREGKSTLLIECQGEYWHSSNKVRAKDQSKATYIANNFPGVYELKYIWEHEFSDLGKIRELLKYWSGITTEQLIDFNFANVMIRLCPARDYKLLLSKYHYLANAGRGGISYGAYLDDILIAVCVFSPPVRQNIAKSMGLTNNQMRELSRLCIHPNYQKKNFASWFVSRCLKMLMGYRRVISYCDTTFNHDGAVYKACNFKLDGEVPADYWYVGADGWVMHKKSLYNHAIKMKMRESEYAEAMGYTKVWGNKKLRFVYNL